jgi:hypothetical protein
MVEGFGVVGLERKRAVEGRERVLEAVDRQQGGSPIVERADIRGIDRGGPIEARECVAETSQLREGETAVVERIDVARIDRRGVLEARQSLLVAESLARTFPRVINAATELGLMLRARSQLAIASS